MLLVAFCFVLSIFAADCKSDGSQYSVCTNGKCEMISETEICTECKVGGNVPINGVCTSKDNVADKCKKASDEVLTEDDKICGKCEGSTFMYKGGCYDKEGELGRAICKTSGATPGVCDECQEGYFKNADNLATTDSCSPCKDAHCAECKDASTTEKCTRCMEGYFIAKNTAEGPCISCSADSPTNSYQGVPGCAKCEKPVSPGPVKCTKCVNDYLKIDAEATTCVKESECTKGFFATIVDGIKKCLKCNDVYSGITGCSECLLLPSASRANKVLIKCIACETDKLSPLGDACLVSCPAGTYAVSGDSGSVCTPCHKSCANCKTNDAETSCTACYPGYSLLYGSDGSADTGKCIKECTGEFGANCADGQCTADVGGAKYCAQCKDGYAPIDGVCTAVTAGRDASMCTAAGGKCTACKGSYALISGGCYGTQKLPGSAVCTAARDGKCSACGNGETQKDGVCPACPTGCSKCAAGSSPQQCSECLPGYYKSKTKCVACNKDDEADIKGVPNCVSCKEPAGSGTVTCYLTQEKTDDSTGGSTNQSNGGLTTGAIAGIAVAVVIVVGGLVGFLCWWFLCRGKA
ncbi:VSP with INR [Giardia lamblia P15]|uniref:VSP with INR n=1 Tax=Giardia intestinalis (strain P15) TaxID=658858 RepID=E1EWV5_GIAIA|nr:VSP with INR [Giardia lamblia P15]